MINPKNIQENYKLVYKGYLSAVCDECVKGNFEKNSYSKEINDFLTQQTKSSKFIYQKSNHKNEDYKDYEEKWQADNNIDGHFGAGNLEPLDIIYSTYYKEDLFKISGGTPREIENEKYIINSFFRGNLIGYDKTKKLYFPIIIESCSHFCDKKIEFIGTNLLNIEYEDSNGYIIDLSNIIIKELNN